MNKDEMKNRISMALKDPILQQGFECICKENAELKEKNRSYEQLIDTGSVTLMKDRLKNYKQLTKAKALLAKWVELYKPKSKTALPTPIQIDTEQFLNSEVDK